MAEASGIESAGEKVLLQAGSCSVTILPRFGGKIASLCVKDRELIAPPLARYGPRTRTMPFDQGDAGGWDECLPSVADCIVETADGPVTIPDHGDLWRMAWTESREPGTGNREQSATLRAECFSLPLTVERTATLTETGKGWQLSLGYTVTNTGDIPVPWSWSAHPLFSAEEGDRIVLPESIHDLRLEGSVDKRMGKGGDRIGWPIATLIDGSKIDLSVAQSPETAVGHKFFAGPLTAAQNWGTLERPRAGVRIRVSFDPSATPYLGLWFCYGGWPDRPGAKQTCMALEPSTSLVDSLAIRGPWSRTLAAGDCFSWPMTVDLESI